MSFTGYLRCRVINPVDGTVVIDPLPHPHESKWTVKFLEPGTVGSSNIGQWELPLYPPQMPEYKNFYSIYQLLSLGYRIEAYFTAIADPAGGPAIGGGVLPGSTNFTPPKFTGIIRQLPSAFNKYTLKGTSALQVLQNARTNRTEYFTGTTDKLFIKSLTGYKLIFADDFLTDLSQWQNAGANVLATDESMAVVRVNGGQSATNSTLLSNTTFGSNSYNDCQLDAMFDLTAVGTGAGSDVAGWPSEAALIACSDSGLANFMMGRAVARYKALSGTIAAHWEIDTEIWRKVAGVWANNTQPLIRKTIVAWTPTNQFRCQVALVGKQDFPAVGNYRWTVLVNGVDSGCFWDQPTGTQSGQSGFRSFGLAGSVAYVGNFCHRNRGPLMQAGKVVGGAKSVKQYFSRAPQLDLTNIAAVTEGFVYRVNPMPGLGNDTVDFGPAANSGLPNSVGIDWQQFIRFEEGQNIVDISIEPNAEKLATDIIMALASGSDNAGTIEWHNIAAMRKYGIITDMVSAQHITDYLAARTVAQSIAGIAGSPNTSKKLTVYRDENTERWREGDFVDVHVPSLGLNHQKMQIMEYTFNEGHDQLELVMDKFPMDASEIQLRRMWQTIDAIASGTSAMTPSAGSGIIYDSAYGAPAMVTAYSGFQAVDSTHNLRLRFTFPQFLAMVQKVTLSIFIMGFRSGLQTSATATTSSAGAAHNHGNVTTGGDNVNHIHGNPNSNLQNANHAHNAGGESAAHAHSTPVYHTGGGGFAVQMAPPDGGELLYSTYVSAARGNIGMNSSFESAGHGHGLSGVTADHLHGIAGTGGFSVAHLHVGGTPNEAGHTHNIPTLNLTLPTSLYETGSASNVNVIIDGTNVTTLLPGGPFNLDQNEIDITAFIIGGGIHDIQLTTATIGGLIAQVNSLCLVKAQ